MKKLLIKTVLVEEAEEPVQEVVQAIAGKLDAEAYRIGMDKNYRVAKVISIFNDGPGFRRVLFEVIEACKDNEGEWYESRYKLLIGVKRKNFLDIVRNLTHGDHVVIGFYAQTYHDKDNSKEFLTLLKLRSLQLVRPANIQASARSIWEASNIPPLHFVPNYI